MSKGINKNSMSNLSSARQNSIYNNSGSLPGILMQDSQRIDYKQVDFGYKNQVIPELKMNEYGKVDMASFLNDNADMMNLVVDDEK